MYNLFLRELFAESSLSNPGCWLPKSTSEPKSQKTTQKPVFPQVSTISHKKKFIFSQIDLFGTVLYIRGIKYGKKSQLGQFINPSPTWQRHPYPPPVNHADASKIPTSIHLPTASPLSQFLHAPVTQNRLDSTEQITRIGRLDQPLHGNRLRSGEFTLRPHIQILVTPQSPFDPLRSQLNRWIPFSPPLKMAPDLSFGNFTSVSAPGDYAHSSESPLPSKLWTSTAPNGDTMHKFTPNICKFFPFKRQQQPAAK